MNTLPNNMQFIKDLQECKFYERLFRNHKVVLILLKGSRVFNLTDDISDYDLDVFIDEDVTHIMPLEYLTYNGKKVHWYYMPLNSLRGEFIDPQKMYNVLDLVGLMQFGYITNDSIIYMNEDYKDTINNLISNKEKISKAACKQLLDLRKNWINQIANASEIAEDMYSKFLYHFCVMSYLLTNEEFDRDFLISIKRIRWQPVPDEYKNKIIERFKILQELVKEGNI